MSYQIQGEDGFVLVRVTGKTSVEELVQAVQELRERDPRKEVSDLWEIAEESTVPISEFPLIVGVIQSFCSSGMAACKTALVAGSELQKAVMEMYRSTAKTLPFSIGVFASREEAVQWLKSSGAV